MNIEIPIEILAEDIRKSEYFKSDDCAMTRAFIRAGLNFHEKGDVIEHVDYVGKKFHDVMPTPQELTSVVKGMYKFLKPNEWLGPTDLLITPLEPADFEFRLTIPYDYVPLKEINVTMHVGDAGIPVDVKISVWYSRHKGKILVYDSEDESGLDNVPGWWPDGIKDKIDDHFHPQEVVYVSH